MIPIGERHFRRAIREFVDHYHHERIIKRWATRSSTASITGRPEDEFVVARGSVGCSTTTNEPRDRTG
jgi:hypothetical protein